MGAALLASAFFVPPTGVWIIVSCVAALGLREFYLLLEAGHIPSFKVIGTVCGLSLIADAWIGCGGPAAFGGRMLDGPGLSLFLSAVVVFARMIFQHNNPRPLETMAGTLMGLIYVGFLMSYFLRLALDWGGVAGRWLVIYLVAVVKAGDIAAYFVGCRIGRHKLFPRISPAKSWEGTVAGLIAAVAASLSVQIAFGGVLGPVRLRPLDAAVLGLLLAICGLFGDLLESLMKRAAGVKDSGTLIAGMGGVLDVIDSLLPAAPVMYYYARLFLPRVT